MYKYFFIFILVFFLILSRFYNLTWGVPFFFHPDERNIASSATQLSFPSQMNPHFFAYGSIPLYTIYFLGIINNILLHAPTPLSISFEQTIIIGRVLSAVFSVILIFLFYKLGTLLFSKQTGIFAAILGTTSIGLIQYAHFATFEMWLTFFSLLLTYFCIRYIKHPSKIFLFSISLFLGILVGTKISSLVLFLPVSLSIFIRSQKKDTNKIIFFLKSLAICCSVIFSVAFLYLLTNPFVFFDTDSFLGSMQYETSVGIGTLPVFYTQGFIHTIPIVYQFFHVFPFILTPLLTGLFVPCFFYFCVLTYKQKNKSLIILTVFFLTLFFSQATLFVKWTRYLIPVLPYMYLVLAYTFSSLLKYTKNKYSFVYKTTLSIVYFLLLYSFLLAGIFLYEVYQKTDTRLEAYAFAKKSIPHSASILSEVYDLGIVPFNDSFTHIKLLNFYDVETNSQTISEISQELSISNYVILPSQRILKNRLLNPSLFPQGNIIYKQFFNTTKYQKIYETPCDIFCKLIYNDDPVFGLEETATVFDRPTLYIFKRL